MRSFDSVKERFSALLRLVMRVLIFAGEALLNAAKFSDVRVSPRMVYVDASRPSFVEGFSKNTFTAMIKGVRQTAIDAGMIDEQSFDEGIRGFFRTTEKDGVFCYTFFKSVAKKQKG